MSTDTAVMRAPTVGEALDTLTPERRRLLRDQVCPPDTTDDEFALFLAMAQRTGLDPFLRQIYMVPRRTRVQTTAQGWRWHTVRRVEVAIGGLQLLATRTGEHDGREGPEWWDGTTWRDVWDRDDAPRAARVRVYRLGARAPFTGTAHYREYVQTTAEGTPTRFWKEMPAHMLAKCAEAIALRAAFPAELTALYVPEERRWEDPPAAPDDVVDAVPAQPPGSQGGPQPGTSGEGGGEMPATSAPAAPRSPGPADVAPAGVIGSAAGLYAAQVAAVMSRLGSRAAACGRWLPNAETPTYELSATRLAVLRPDEREAIAAALAATDRQTAGTAPAHLDVDPAEIPDTVGR